MRVAHDEGRREDAASHELLQEEGAERLRRLALLVERAIPEVRVTAAHADEVLDPRRCDRRLDLRAEQPPHLVHVPDHVVLAIDVHRRDRRGEAVRLRAVRRREKEDTRPLVTDPAALHELAPPGERRDREPVGHGLAERRQVGDDPVLGLRAAEPPAEAGDHLVEHEDRALPVAEIRDPLQEAVERWLLPLGLEDDARDPTRMLGEEALEARQVVVRERQRQICDRCRDARVDRRRADEPVVVREEGMVRAEDDEVPARGRPRQLDGGRVRARPVLRELDHVGAGHDVEERLGALELDHGRAREVGALAESRLRGAHDCRIRMPETDRPQPHPVLDELVPLRVPDPAALSADEQGGRVRGPLVVALRVGVRAARYRGVQPLAQVLLHGVHGRLLRHSGSTRPTSTHALCPPRPIAFDNATSTCTSRASFGT